MGVAEVGLLVTDMEASSSFVQDFLGYAQVVGGKDGRRTFRLSPKQYLTLIPTSTRNEESMLSYVLLETTDLHGMARYLRSKGVCVPRSFGKDPLGEESFLVGDSPFCRCGFVQYPEGGEASRLTGVPLPDSGIAPRMSHVGFAVGDLQKAFSFYRDILGLSEVWRNPPLPENPSVVHMALPDAPFTLEFLPYYRDLSYAERCSKNHICLEVGSIFPCVGKLSARRAPEGVPRSSEIKVGHNGKRQANYFFPDGTRVEVMEDHLAEE